jgi:hypothetical protein
MKTKPVQVRRKTRGKSPQKQAKNEPLLALPVPLDLEDRQEAQPRGEPLIRIRCPRRQIENLRALAQATGSTLNKVLRRAFHDAETKLASPLGITGCWARKLTKEERKAIAAKWRLLHVAVIQNWSFPCSKN